MPLPISLTLLLGAIALGLTGLDLGVWIMVGLAVANETLRLIVLRSQAAASNPATYTIPARRQPTPIGDQSGS